MNTLLGVKIYIARRRQNVFRITNLVIEKEV
jgi:hypothetical protein